MKTDERTKDNLETSEEELEDVNDVLLHIMPYWRAIAGVLALVIGGIVLFFMLSNGRKTAREAGWTNYLAASANRDAQGLQEIADGSTGEVAGMAQQAAAQAKLIDGSALVYRDRAAAKKSFEEAAAGFTQAIALAGDQDLIHKQALLGLAQAHEGLNELAKAKQQYQQLMDKWPESPVAEQAKKQIARLDDPKEKEFYDWFYAQSPPAQQLPPSGEVLPFNVPSQPDIQIPDPSNPPAEDSATENTSTDASAAVSEDAAVPANAETDGGADAE